MANDDDMLGLTMGELAMLVAFSLILFVFIWGAGDRQKDEGLENERSAAAQAAQQLQAEVLELEAARKRDRLEKEALETELLFVQRRLRNFESEREELERQERELRSAQRPSCREIGLTDRFLFSTVILSRQQYRIESETADLRGILSNYRNQLSSSRDNDCVHQIDVSYLQGMSAEDYHVALRALEQYFYVRRSNPVPE